MEFAEALKIVTDILATIGSDVSGKQYDGLIVKRLESSNTLDEGKSNQTHIAITGKQMDLFPYVRADGYFEVQYDDEDPALKKYFVAQIPAYLHKENVEYLDPSANIFSEEECKVYVSIVRSRRKNATDQIQMSMTNMDSDIFVDFRKLVHAKSYIVILKQAQKLQYDIYAIKAENVSAELESLNNEFFKQQTNTLVKIDQIAPGEKDSEVYKRVELPFNESRYSAKIIIDCIYELDQLARICDILTTTGENGKEKVYIRIKTDDLGGKYLDFAFKLPDHKVYEGKRVFPDKTYTIVVEGKPLECRLSTEWVSISLEKSTPKLQGGTNHLQALIKIVNACYADLLRVVEDNGKWYLEILWQKFNVSKIPSRFDGLFAKRYITSLLAKPFVILTGNSGTGKTRIAKQFAEYLQAIDENGNPNWLIVPVGADWTDNTKVLGYYNPMANHGAGKYEKTKIIELIERANAHPETPYFLILDEMNLSHVERYFADFLSHMEIPDDPFELNGYGEKLPFPGNLFVTGTVNIDETTYMFSPKVLDRANVVEFKPDKDSVIGMFGESMRQAPIAAAPRGTAEAFYRLAKEIRDGKCDIDETQMNEIRDEFSAIYEATEKHGYEFAYRTVKEIKQYLSAAYELSDSWDSATLYQAVDEQLLQKILPKIHGNRKEIGSMLEELLNICKTENKELKMSEAKIEQMKGRLSSVQYASFI